MTPAPTFRFREINPFLGGATSTTIKDSALIVIDAQRFYLADGDWPVHGILETNKRIEALVERYREVSPPLFCAAHGWGLIMVQPIGWRRSRLGRSYR